MEDAAAMVGAGPEDIRSGSCSEALLSLLFISLLLIWAKPVSADRHPGMPGSPAFARPFTPESIARAVDFQGADGNRMAFGRPPGPRVCDREAGERFASPRRREREVRRQPPALMAEMAAAIHDRTAPVANLSRPGGSKLPVCARVAPVAQTVCLLYRRLVVGRRAKVECALIIQPSAQVANLRHDGGRPRAFLVPIPNHGSGSTI
jgi:hypothetical protein